MAKAFWPGRLELFKVFTTNHELRTVLLDGAHNPAGMRSLAENLQALRSGGTKIVSIFGVLKDKDYRRMVEIIAPLVERSILVRPGSDRALDPQRIRELWPANKQVSVAGSIPQAIRQALKLAGKKDLVTISGSLYTVGEARKYLIKLNNGGEQNG